MVLEKTLENTLDSKEIKQSIFKGNKSWISIRRTDAEAPILWPFDAKSWLIGKDPNTGKNWGQEEKGATKDEMVRWYNWLNGHEFEWTQGDSDGTEKPGVLQFMGSQRAVYNLVAEQQQ